MKDLTGLSVIELVALREQVILKMERVDDSKLILAITGYLHEDEFESLINEGLKWNHKRNELNTEIESREIEW